MVYHDKFIYIRPKVEIENFNGRKNTMAMKKRFVLNSITFKHFQTWQKQNVHAVECLLLLRVIFMTKRDVTRKSKYAVVCMCV